jgi:hypothetical protein
MTRRRKRYSPSTGRKLSLIVANESGKRRYSGACLTTVVEDKRDEITSLAGADRAEWASEQLKAVPEQLKPGWPNPCKAARMSMPARKAVQQ